MKTRALVVMTIINSGFVLDSDAHAAELKVLSAVGMQSVMAKLAPEFERASGHKLSGHKLSIAFVTAGAAVKRVQSGEPADVAIATQQGIDGLIRDGKAAPSGEPALASAGISAAVRKGTPKPDISSPDALKRTLLAATSISYVNPASGGASSIHFVKVLDRLGIATEMKSKTVFSHSNTPAEVGALVASGVAELGVHVIVELIPVVGIDVIGPLPGDLQNSIVFSAAVIADTREPEAAKALVAFLCRPEAASVMRAKGLEPAIR